MTFLNNMNISKKLTVGFTLVVAVVAITCVSVGVSLWNISKAVELNDSSMAQLKLADTVLMAAVERL